MPEPAGRRRFASGSGRWSSVRRAGNSGCRRIATDMQDAASAKFNLAAIHGLVDRGNDGFEIAAVLRIVPDADRDIEVDAVGLRPFVDCPPDAPGDDLAVFRRGMRQDEQEFVAAVARHHIDAANDFANAFGDGDQDTVSDMMPVRIVHILEAIEIGKEHDGLPAMNLGRVEQLHDTLVEGPPVEHPGQRVDIALVGELGPGSLDLGGQRIGVKHDDDEEQEEENGADRDHGQIIRQTQPDDEDRGAKTANDGLAEAFQAVTHAVAENDHEEDQEGGRAERGIGQGGKTGCSNIDPHGQVSPPGNMRHALGMPHETEDLDGIQ